MHYSSIVPELQEIDSESLTGSFPSAFPGKSPSSAPSSYSSMPNQPFAYPSSPSSAFVSSTSANFASGGRQSMLYGWEEVRDPATGRIVYIDKRNNRMR